MNFPSIASFIQTLADEGYPARLVVEVNSLGRWSARIESGEPGGGLLLDRNGDKSMVVMDDFMESALAGLERKAAVGQVPL